MPTDRHTATGTCEFGRAANSAYRSRLQENSTHRAKKFPGTACDDCSERGPRMLSCVVNHCSLRTWHVKTNFCPQKTRSYKLALVSDSKKRGGKGAATMRAAPLYFGSVRA